MKKTLLIALLLMAGIATCIAQPGNRSSPEERLNNEVKRLTKVLVLTSDQVAKVTPIVKEAHEKLSEVTTKMPESGKMDRTKLAEERKKINEAQDLKLTEVISKEQSIKLQELRVLQEKERKEREQNRNKQQ